MRLQTWYKPTNQGDFLTKQTISDESSETVVTIHAPFFKKSKRKKRKVLRLLIWWSIKQ